MERVVISIKTKTEGKKEAEQHLNCFSFTPSSKIDENQYLVDDFHWIVSY